MCLAPGMHIMHMYRAASHPGAGQHRRQTGVKVVDTEHMAGRCVHQQRRLQCKTVSCWTRLADKQEQQVTASCVLRHAGSGLPVCVPCCEGPS
jgi:hypothetical protein